MVISVGVVSELVIPVLVMGRLPVLGIVVLEPVVTEINYL